MIVRGDGYMYTYLMEHNIITDCREELPFTARDNNDVHFFRDKITDIIYADKVDKIVDDELYPKEPTEDDLRRKDQWFNLLKGKRVLDFGCGSGTFVELMQDDCRISGYDEYTGDNSEVLHDGYDAITMFHVLEHLREPLKVLAMLNKLLYYNGLLIIEVPHARDALFSVTEYMKNALWSQHLIYHTRQSLKTFLYHAGFSKVEIYGYQRYDLKNHIKWMIDGRESGIPNGIIYQESTDYKKCLYLADRTDTLIAVASK